MNDETTQEQDHNGAKTGPEPGTDAAETAQEPAANITEDEGAAGDQARRTLVMWQGGIPAGTQLTRPEEEVGQYFGELGPGGFRGAIGVVFLHGGELAAADNGRGIREAAEKVLEVAARHVFGPLEPYESHIVTPPSIIKPGTPR